MCDQEMNIKESHGIVRGSSWSSGVSGTTTCPPAPGQGILHRRWASWIVGGRLELLGEPWLRLESRGVVEGA